MKRFLLLLVVGLLLAGNAFADNSRFYGSYNSTLTDCSNTFSSILTIGGDSSRKSEDWYMYIPLNGSSINYIFVDDGESVTRSITIAGNSYIVDEVGTFSGGKWSSYSTSVFSNDYQTISETGTFSDTFSDPEDGNTCSGSLTGSATRILTKPTTPILSSPSNGLSDASLTPTLTTEAFSDPDAGDTHLQTEWQISSSSDFSSIVLNESSTSNLTSLTIPASALQQNTTYYWRAKFYDNRNTASDWSSAFSFTTLQTFTDTNENGIPDTLENDTVDLDEDGIADIEQTDKIKSLNTVVGSGQIGISIKESTTVTKTVEINSIDPSSISETIRPHSMPLGMISFKLDVANPGDTADVKVHFSEAAPENASWFFHDSINGWIDYSQYVTFSDDRKSASVQLKDGGYGDSDGVENGVIVDPCGFGIASWLKGKITDSADSKGLPKVTVALPDIDLNLNTMSDGSYLSMILPGIYDIDVSMSGYQSEALTDIEVTEAEIVTKDISLSGRCKINGLEVTGTPSTSGPVALKVNAQSGSETINYRYSIHDGYGTAAYDGSHWTGMTPSEYQTENSCDYSFTSSGESIVVAWATSSNTDNIDPTGIPIIGWSIDTSDSTCKTNFTGVTITGEQKVNEKMTFAVGAENSCGNNKYYRFSLHPYYGTSDYDGNHWQSMTSTEWISSNSADYTFTEAGKYIIVVWVADDTSSVDPNGIPIIGWSVDIE